ncbi:MAG: sigma-70 family RNA polymerase sigma factor [Bacteroidetes bacterium]|nr:sigma-70 family RNA polymerase sigma factor [Bacteroidota bacterium]
MANGFTNEAEFQIFFREYYPKLYSYGFKIMPNHFLLEDCIMELFSDLWKNAGKTEINSMNAYLFKSLQYKIFKKGAYEHKSMSSSPDQFEIPFEITAESLIVEGEENIEKAKKISALMVHLSARQREIIYLRFYKNFSYDEISELMQINYQAARNLLSLSLKVLRKAIDQDVTMN